MNLEKFFGKKEPANEISGKVKKWLTKDKLLLIMLGGVLLFIITLPVSNDSSDTESELKSEANTCKTVTVTEDTYAEILEARLEKILCTAKGVGKVNVMVTVKDTGELITIKESSVSESNMQEEDSEGGSRTSSDKTIDESVVFGEYEDGSSLPYVVNEMNPEILGVCVIAQGADDSNVVSDIIDAVSALLGVSSNKIKVMKMEV